MAGRLSKTHVAGDHGVESRSRKYSRNVSVTCWARLVRSSYIVNRTPSIVTPGLKAARTRSRVGDELGNTLKSEVLGLHWNQQELAATKALSVSRSSAGGQSRTIRSNRS